MFQSHFHAFGRNAPYGGIFIQVLQFTPLAGAQLSRSKKRQSYELQCKLGLLLATVTLQLPQERWQLREWHRSVTLRFAGSSQSVLEID